MWLAPMKPSLARALDTQQRHERREHEGTASRPKTAAAATTAKKDGKRLWNGERRERKKPTGEHWGQVEQQTEEHR